MSFIIGIVNSLILVNMGLGMVEEKERADQDVCELEEGGIHVLLCYIYKQCTKAYIL